MMKKRKHGLIHVKRLFTWLRLEWIKGRRTKQNRNAKDFYKKDGKKLTTQKGTGRKIESKHKINKHPIHNAYETNIIFDGRQKQQNCLNNLAWTTTHNFAFLILSHQMRISLLYVIYTWDYERTVRYCLWYISSNNNESFICVKMIVYMVTCYLPHRVPRPSLFLFFYFFFFCLANFFFRSDFFLLLFFSVVIGGYEFLLPTEIFQYVITFISVHLSNE